MSSTRWLTALETLVILAASLAVFALSEVAVDYRLAIQFLVVVFVLDLLDLSMPYGEAMPVDSAIVVACLVLAGPLTAALVAVVARVAVQLARHGTQGLDRMISLLSRRLTSIAVCGVLMTAIPLSGTDALSDLYIQGFVAGLAFMLTELILAQVQAAPRLHERFAPLVLGNFTLQGPLLAAQVSVSVLTVITYGYMGVWALVVMSLLMALMRQSLALFLAIRQAYRATIEALVAAIEAQDPRRKGHAERVESYAKSIALSMGIRGRALENLAYAALLHDVDMLGIDLTEADSPMLRHSAETVSSVRFLSEVVPILRLCDGHVGDEDLPFLVEQAAAVVAVASDLDDEANPKVGGSRQAIDRVTIAGVSVHAIGAAQFAAASVRSERTAPQ